MKTAFYHIIFFFFLLVFSACSSSELIYDKTDIAPYYSQNDSRKYLPDQQSNQNLDFHNFICGVNSVVILTEEKLETTINNDDEFYRKYHKLMNHYLSGIGFNNVAVTLEDQKWIENNIPLEETTILKLKLDATKNYVSKISMIFKSCNGDEFTFSSKSDYYIDNNWDNFLLNKLKEMYWYRVEYNPENNISLKYEMTAWNRKSLMDHFDKNGSTQLEGIYEKYGMWNMDGDSRYEIALIKEEDKYKIIYLDGAIRSNNWREGELKGTISNSSIKDFYKVNWIMSDKSSNNNVYLTTSNYNFLEFDFLDSESGFRTRYLKMYPRVSDEIASSENYMSSGTGFFISNDGYLVTNHHIVKGAKYLSVQIENEKEVKEYKVEVVLDDRDNDLTILKIKNNEFQIKNNIPFQIANDEVPIGTPVFTMGYPMIETMGESVKLSNGIVSSNSGYMSNSSLYQVTVPINPGNSGGPLFDENGNLVGIVNARYTGAENVAYAIKSKFLLDMLKELKIDKTNLTSETLQELKLPEKVKILDDVVCLIKAYN